MHTAIQHYLDTPSAAASVLAHARRLRRLDGVLHQSLPAPLARLARVANLKAGVVVILAENGSAAVKLRQMAGRLQNAFTAAGAECKSIEVKVQPSQTAFESKSSTIKPIPAEGRQHIQSLLEKLPDDSPLQHALKHLLDRAA